MIVIKRSKTFENFIKEHEIVLAYCGLTFCVPCKKIHPYIEELSTKYENIKFCKITLDELEDECSDLIKQQLNLTKYPSFTLINNGNILEHIIGTDKDKINKMLECANDTNEDF